MVRGRVVGALLCVALAGFGLSGCSSSDAEDVKDSTSQETKKSESKDKKKSKPEEKAEKVTEGTVAGCSFVIWSDGTLEFTGDTIGSEKDELIEWTFDDDTYGSLYGVKRIKSGPIKASGSLRGLFSYAESLTDISDLAKWDVSEVTVLAEMFDRCSSLENIDALADWDISNVRSLGYLFNETKVSDVDALAKWNTSNVESMGRVFAGTEVSNVDALAGWDFSKVITVHSMFMDTGITSLDELPEEWDLSNAGNVEYIFGHK